MNMASKNGQRVYKRYGTCNKVVRNNNMVFTLVAVAVSITITTV